MRVEYREEDVREEDVREEDVREEDVREDLCVVGRERRRAPQVM